MQWLKSPSTHLPSDNLPGRQVLVTLTDQLDSAGLTMKAGLGWIFNLGVQPDMPFYLVKNLALVNRVAFTSLLLALPGTFILMLAGFSHPLSLLVSGITILFLVLSLNASHQPNWGLAIFAFSPSLLIVFYSLSELSSGGLTDPIVYVLARQGLCLALLLPLVIFGFDRSHRWMVLASCLILFLLFDVACLKIGGVFVENATGIGPRLFSVLSVVQFSALAACLLYLQGYTLQHEQKMTRSNEKMQGLLVRDGMTGLFNRTFMEQLIGDAINRSRRSQTPLSLLMIDVDEFKQINDTLGHNAGDEVLKELTRLLDGCKRSTDYLGRWGGDELVLLLTDTNLQGATIVAEKIRQLVEKHVFSHNRHLTISLGASEYSDPDTMVTFVERADTAMYLAKQAGRNQVGS